MNAKSREIIKTGVVRNPGVMSKMDRENIKFYMKVQFYRSANGFFDNILAILCLLRDSQCEKEFSIFIMILTFIIISYSIIPVFC